MACFQSAYMHVWQHHATCKAHCQHHAHVHHNCAAFLRVMADCVPMIGHVQADCSKVNFSLQVTHWLHRSRATSWALQKQHASSATQCSFSTLFTQAHDVLVATCTITLHPAEALQMFLLQVTVNAASEPLWLEQSWPFTSTPTGTRLTKTL